MADKEKKILYTVEIDGNEALLNELARLRKETSDLKNENQAYNKSLKAGERVSKEQARNFERNTIQIKDNNASIRNLTKELQTSNKEKDNARKRLTEMRRALQEMALAGDTSSEAYRTLRGEAAELQDAIDRVNREVKVFADDAMILNTVVDSTRAITAGFQGIMGVQALLGFESEKFRETMQRLVAVQQVSNALQTVSNMLQKESRLVILGKVAAVKIVTAAQWAWNTAMTANPIGLIVTAVAALVLGLIALVRNFDRVTEAIRKAANWLVFWKDLSGTVKETVEEMDDVAAIMDRLSEALDEMGRSSQRTTRQLQHQMNVLRILGALDDEDETRRKLELEEQELQNLENKLELTQEEIEAAREIIRVQKEVRDGVTEWDKMDRGRGHITIREANKLIEENKEKLQEMLEIEEDLIGLIDDKKRSVFEEQLRLAVITDSVEKQKELLDAEIETAKERINLLEVYIKNTEQNIDRRKHELYKDRLKDEKAGLAELESLRETLAVGMERRSEELERAEAERLAEMMKREEKAAAKLAKLREGTLESYIDLFEIERREALSNTDLTYSERLLLEKEYEQKRIDLIEEYHRRAEERRQELIEDLRGQLSGSFNERLKQLSDFHNEGIIREEDYHLMIRELQAEENERLLKVDEIFRQTRGDAIERGYRRDREELKRSFNEKEIDSKEYYERLKALEEQYEGEKKLQDIQLWYNEQEKLLADHLMNKTLTIEEYNKLIEELDKRREEKQREIDLENFEEERNRYMEHLRQMTDQGEHEYNLRREQYKAWLDSQVISQEEYNEAIKKLDQDLLDFRRETAMAQAQAMVASYRTMTQGLSQLMANQSKESKFFKAMAIADATIALMLGLAQTWKVGFPQAIPMAIGYVAQTAGLVSQMKSTPQPTPPKLAEGGIMVGGKPHSLGGTLFKGSDGSVFEAERDEYLAIVNKRDAERAQMLDQVNQKHGKAFGLASYGNGGIFHKTVSMFQSGGLFEPRHDYDRIDLSDVIREAVDEISQIPVVVNERDISTTQDRVRKIQVKGDL